MSRKYRTILRLECRMFSRQMENYEFRLDEIRGKVQDLFLVRVAIGEEKSYLIPVLDENAHNNKGHLLYSTPEGPQVCINATPFDVVCDSYEHAEEMLGKLDEKLPDTFASVQIVREYITEILAI